MAKQNNLLAYMDNGGVILDLQHGQQDRFVEAGGVYWIKLYVKKGFMSKDAGFQRPA